MNTDKTIKIKDQEYKLTDILDSEQVLAIEQIELATANEKQMVCIVGVDYITIFEAKPIAKTQVVVDKHTDGKLMFSVFETLTESDLNITKDINLENFEYQFYIIHEKEPENKTAEVVQSLIDIFKNAESTEEGEEEVLEESLEEDDDDNVNKIIHMFLQLSDEEQEEILDQIMDCDCNDTNDGMLMEISHMSDKQRLMAKLRRQKPSVKLALKKRRMRNSKCPQGMAWSSKTNTCKLKDPKRSISMKRAASYRVR